MKVLVFADLHEDYECFEVLKEKAKQAEIILGAGDYTLFGNKLNKLLSMINSLNKPCYLIHGNHEEPKEMEEEIKKFKNLEFIHKRKIKYKTLEIAGYGGDGFSHKDLEAEKFFDKSKPKDSIILFHGPPFGISLDEVGFGHCGNESYTNIITQHKPRLVVCGHIHEHFGKIDKINDTIIINPGPLGVILDV
ncbi:MAG: metallophosphoesterase family protein [Candidatus Woesearchaeota archaeon]